MTCKQINVLPCSLLLVFHHQLIVFYLNFPHTYGHIACDHHPGCMKSIQMRSYFWFIFSCIRTEYRKLRTRNNSVFGHLFTQCKVFTYSSCCQKTTYPKLLITAQDWFDAKAGHCVNQTFFMTSYSKYSDNNYIKSIC